jgi:hypothetical protein
LEVRRLHYLMIRDCEYYQNLCEDEI